MQPKMSRAIGFVRKLSLLAVITGISFTLVTNQRLSRSLYYYSSVTAADFSLPTWDTASAPTKDASFRKTANEINSGEINEPREEHVRKRQNSDAIPSNDRHLIKRTPKEQELESILTEKAAPKTSNRGGGEECIPRPQHIQQVVNSRLQAGKNPLIYLHQNSGDSAIEEMYFPNNEKPACFKCEYTTDKSRATEADVVVVLGDENLAEVAPRKYCGQLFVLLQTKTPNKIDEKLTPKEKFVIARGMFDATSSYRLDSDLPRPYHQDAVKLLAETRKNYVPTNKRDSEFPVAWIANDCDSTNHRTEYVKELMKHIGVKSYGDCLNNAQAPNWPESADTQVAQHKFYLAFEDSNCDYRVTNQFYKPLGLGVIPIVMGAPQAHMYVPNNHSALFVNDFESPQALAERIQEINKDDKLFKHYTSHVHDSTEIDTAFRTRWMRKRPAYSCQLCDLAKRSFGANLRGVVYEDWTACEEQHGTWKTNFQAVQA